MINKESGTKTMVEYMFKIAGKILSNFCSFPKGVMLFLGFSASYSLAQVSDVEQMPIEAGEFSLFGEVANDSGDGDRDMNQSSRRNRSPRDEAEPEFTLVGTSRIGDRYSAILKNRDGSEVVVAAEEGRNTRIEGFSQYSVVDVNPGRISIQYPNSSSCVEYRDRGVSCNSAANIATLELTKGEPIPPAIITAREEAVEEEGEVIVSEEKPEEPTNPFAALRARALQNGDAQAPSTTPRRSFTPRRISPDDVPPGMRIVSTPFGDRLVRE